MDDDSESGRRLLRAAFVVQLREFIACFAVAFFGSSAEQHFGLIAIFFDAAADQVQLSEGDFGGSISGSDGGPQRARFVGGTLLARVGQGGG